MRVTKGNSLLKDDMTKSKRPKRKALKKELYRQKRELEEQIDNTDNDGSDRLVFFEGEFYTKRSKEAIETS
jgi:hypothetical protein